MKNISSVRSKLGEATFFSTHSLVHFKAFIESAYRITSLKKKIFGRASPRFSLEAALRAPPNRAYVYKAVIGFDISLAHRNKWSWKEIDNASRNNQTFLKKKSIL